MSKYLLRLISALFILTIVAAPAMAGEKEDAFKEILGLLQQKYVDKVDSEKLYEGAIKGMLESLDDPYTVYFDTYGFKDFMQEFESSFSGIGVQIKDDAAGVKIVSVFTNSPAQKVGLKANDIITTVDGKQLGHKGSSYAAQLIRGKEGSKVRLTVKRGNKQFAVTVTRGTIDNPSVEYKTLGKIGYIKINEFKDDTAGKTEKAIKYFNSKKATSLILDLRDNPGGELDAALNICDLLLPAGPMIQIVSGEGKKHTISAQGKGYGKPIVVLINGGSASASEVVSGALQDRGAAILVGEKSFGKASVQSIIPLESSGGLKMTVAHYLTPKGRYIHGKGIEPDLFIKEKVLDKALELLNHENYKLQSININTSSLAITVDSKKLTEKAARLGGKYYLPLRTLADTLGYDIKMDSKSYILKAKQKTFTINKKDLKLFNHKGYISVAEFAKGFNIKLPTKLNPSYAFNF